MVRVTLEERPADGSTHWSTRTLAEALGVSKETVRRIWADHGLRPWRVETFKLCNDPRFEEKLVDVVGLYLNPPAAGGGVLASTRRPRCQALDRTQPSLPMKRGRGATMTHDYKRNGTIDLFAAMNIATGEVTHRPARSATPARDVLRVLQADRPERPARAWRSTSSSTTSPPTMHHPRSTWLRTSTAAAGTCTSPRPRARG